MYIVCNKSHDGVFHYSERNKLREKSTSLEDESRLVKESLVQRLTEMATTSKVLSLDNQRLRAKVYT